MILKNGLITQNYTYIECEDKEKQEFNAPHHFKVYDVVPKMPGADSVLLTEVNFQKGPIKENGANGCCNEDLIAMVISRLEGFQSSDYRCRENAVAITKLEESLMWLRKRTMDREVRNVEGTSSK